MIAVVQIENETYKIYNTAIFDERVDEQFDTGTIQIVSESGTPFPDFSRVVITLKDKTFYFYGFDTVEKRGTGYFIHTLELCEPTRRLMGIFIDGRKVTQPVDGSKKKSLWKVLSELLKTYKVFGKNAPGNLFADKKMEDAFKAVVSPEFHWEAGTSLWECLCDIGSVVNRIPRLIRDVASSGSIDYVVITFDDVNKITDEYLLDDDNPITDELPSAGGSTGETDDGDDDEGDDDGGGSDNPTPKPEPEPDEPESDEPESDEPVQDEDFEYTLGRINVNVGSENEEYVDGYIIKYTSDNRELVIHSIPSEYNGTPVLVIGEEGFYEVIQQNYLYLPESIVIIEAYAFQNAKISRLYIYNGVKQIKEKAFAEFVGKIVFRGTKEEWEEIEKDSDWNDGATIEMEYMDF